MSNVAIFPRAHGTQRPEPPDTPTERRGPLRPASLIPTRRRLSPASLATGFRTADTLAVAALTAVTAQIAIPAGLFGASMPDLAPFAAAALLLLWSLRRFDVYAFGSREGLLRHYVRVAAAFAFASVAVWAFTALVMTSPPWSRTVGFAPRIGLSAMLTLHGLWWMLVQRWRSQGRLTPNIVIVGANASAERLVTAALASGEVAVLGVFDDRLSRAPKTVAGVPVLGDSNALLNHRILPSVDRIVIAVEPDARERVRALVERLNGLPNEVTLVLDPERAPDPSAFSRLADLTLQRVSGRAADARKAFSKRVQDLVIGSAALLIASPVMLLIAVAVRLDSPGPIFFRQRRHGFNNEEILIRKFRSMRHEPNPDGPWRQARVDDERVTEVGRFLRRTSLDELPQLLNVITGEMSLVGPRPHAVGMMTGDADSTQLVATYAHRHRIKPGMTGWAAVNGSRGPVDTPELVRRRVALDIEYIERQSLWMDLRILAATIPCLLGDRSMVR